MTVKLRQWKWDILPTYNGFNHDERVRGWQLVSWFVDNGWMPKASICAISGSTERVGLHSENYYGLQSYPLSQSVHFALHQRFKRPDAWKRIVERHSFTGEEWFATLAMTPTDFAAELRAAHGDEIADVFARAPIPSGVIVPVNEIHKSAALQLATEIVPS